jgi:hypothetical protein
MLAEFKKGFAVDADECAVAPRGVTPRLGEVGADVIPCELTVGETRINCLVVKRKKRKQKNSSSTERTREKERSRARAREGQ